MAKLCSYNFLKLSFCKALKGSLQMVVFYIKKLKKEFLKTVKRVQNEDAASYRTFRLKERLRKKFPQLVFDRPKVRTKSDIVYSECLSKGSVAESFIEDDVEISQSSQESDYAVLELLINVVTCH